MCDCARDEGPAEQGIREAAEGLELSTFCMASGTKNQNAIPRQPSNRAWLLG